VGERLNADWKIWLPLLNDDFIRFLDPQLQKLRQQQQQQQHHQQQQQQQEQPPQPTGNDPPNLNLSDLLVKIKQQEREFQANQEQLDHLRENIRNADKLLSKKDEQIATLTTELARVNTELVILQFSNPQTERITALVNEKETTDAKLNQVLREVAALKQLVEDLKKQLQEEQSSNSKLSSALVRPSNTTFTCTFDEGEEEDDDIVKCRALSGCVTVMLRALTVKPCHGV